MADMIQLLPDAVANQIAAGEVIQRPASVVKELLENSVDAGSTSIKLVIKEAGKTLIQVSDNGCGMSETDARMALERHATSKIRRIEDLFSIRSMGFRGEALASMAAVARMEIKTKRAGEETGTRIEVAGSEVKAQAPCGCPDGTTISVKNLFFNVPARRNFLKSNQVETSHIIDEFKRVALAHPDIRFDLFHKNTQVYHLPATKPRQRLVGVLGKRYHDKVVPVEENTDIIRIKGFAGKPEAAKKTRGDQFFFINKRYIRDPYLHHAVMNAYEELLPKETLPLYVLFIDIDPKQIDINVHPTKQEVKFEDQRSIYAIIKASVKRALGQFSVTPALDFEQEPGIVKMTNPTHPPVHNPGKSGFKQATDWSTDTASPPGGLAPSEPGRERRNRSHWEKLYEGLKQAPPKDQTPAQPEEEKSDKAQTRLLPSTEATPGEASGPYQLHGRYMLTHIKSGLMIIDQQAAHQRILYERYRKALEQQQNVSQQQLFPQTVRFTPADTELLQDIMPEVKMLGFDIKPLGKNTFVVRSVPAHGLIRDEQDLLEQLLEQYKNHVSVLELDKQAGLAYALARQTSMKPPHPLKPKEMRHLIDELFGCQQPYHAPSGEPTFITLSLEELAGQFKG